MFCNMWALVPTATAPAAAVFTMVALALLGLLLLQPRPGEP